MNIQMTAGEALQAFCRAWFVERDVEAAMAFIREAVSYTHLTLPTNSLV